MWSERATIFVYFFLPLLLLLKFSVSLSLCICVLLLVDARCRAGSVEALSAKLISTWRMPLCAAKTTIGNHTIQIIYTPTSKRTSGLQCARREITSQNPKYLGASLFYLWSGVSCCVFQHYGRVSMQRCGRGHLFSAIHHARSFFFVYVGIGLVAEPLIRLPLPSLHLYLVCRSWE